jgi:hypothetical protein
MVRKYGAELDLVNAKKKKRVARPIAVEQPVAILSQFGHRASPHSRQP